MIAPHLFAHICRLLAEDTLSQREIARRVGVSRGTVDKIASGRDCERDDEPAEPTKPPQRCPICGALVYLPCLLCRMRRMSRSGRLPTQPDTCGNASIDDTSSDMPIELQLKEEHQRRYEEIRAGHGNMP
jgi:hypothetical protein